MAEVFKKEIPVVAPAFRIPRNSGTPVPYVGNQVQQVACAVYDTAANDSGGVANTTIAAHGTGVYIPKNAIITRAWFQVKTAFTSSTNAGTIAISAQTANDIKTATAVSNAIYGTAIVTDGVPVDTAATRIVLTAEREIVCTVAIEALTAGKLYIFVEYVLGA